MTVAELISLAEEIGFEFAKEVNMDALEFMPEVREMCAADKCNSYNKNWACPPASGTLEEMREKVKHFTGGVLVQTMAELEDDFDFETMAEASRDHKERFKELTEKVRAAGADAMFMGAGGCNICAKCTYPDEPCRFPDRALPSMESCGLLVSKVCTDSGLEYYHGKGTLAYTGCVLIA